MTRVNGLGPNVMPKIPKPGVGCAVVAWASAIIVIYGLLGYVAWRFINKWW